MGKHNNAEAIRVESDYIHSMFPKVSFLGRFVAVRPKKRQNALKNVRQLFLLVFIGLRSGSAFVPKSVVILHDCCH